MILIREFENESLDTICHIVTTQKRTDADTAIDEQNLAWMFIDPDYCNNDCCEQLLKWVYSLLGNDAWMVLQTSGAASEGMLAQFDLDMIESYRSDSTYDHAIDLMLLRKTN